MMQNRKELGMKWVVLAGAVATVLLIGLGTAAYAAAADTATEESRVAGASFFDPFLLTRVLLPPSSASVRAGYVASTVRAANANG
ncbi:MAG: hypothetical protein ACYS74_21035, partial [Planctomycetota bacterium]